MPETQTSEREPTSQKAQEVGAVLAAAMLTREGQKGDRFVITTADGRQIGSFSEGTMADLLAEIIHKAGWRPRDA
jgi:hypothetical protein